MRIKKENEHLLSAYFFLQAHKDEVNLFTVYLFIIQAGGILWNITMNRERLTLPS